MSKPKRSSNCCETCAFVFSGGRVGGSALYRPARRLVDIEAMPGFNPAAITTETKTGLRSVTDGDVFHGELHWMSGAAKRTIVCKRHGAMLCVGSSADGKLWRCTACGAGAWEVLREAKPDPRWPLALRQMVPTTY